MDIIKDSHISFVNLTHRTDRLLHMFAELDRVGMRAERFNAFLPSDITWEPGYKLQTMMNRTPGAIGCHFSQTKIMQQAYELGKHAWVMEDDIVFCEDFNERLPLIEDFLSNNDWDVFWFGGTYHAEPVWHKNPHPKDLKQCNCQLNKDSEQTDNSRIVRTYGCFGTYCYLVNHKSIQKILQFFDTHVHESMGIDWLFILMQPQLNAFAFNPGCVKQYDNKSDIGNGMTYFSGFESLGKHWYQEKMQ